MLSDSSLRLSPRCTISPLRARPIISPGPLPGMEVWPSDSVNTDMRLAQTARRLSSQWGRGTTLCRPRHGEETQKPYQARRAGGTDRGPSLDSRTQLRTPPPRWRPFEPRTQARIRDTDQGNRWGHATQRDPEGHRGTQREGGGFQRERNTGPTSETEKGTLSATAHPLPLPRQRSCQRATPQLSQPAGKVTHHTEGCPSGASYNSWVQKREAAFWGEKVRLSPTSCRKLSVI